MNDGNEHKQASTYVTEIVEVERGLKKFLRSDLVLLVLQIGESRAHLCAKYNPLVVNYDASYLRTGDLLD